MKKIFLANLVISLISIGIFLGVNARISSAAGHSFTQVVPFSTNSGALAFFDQASGRIYLYDSGFKNCTLKLQLNQLGEPIESSEASAPTENKRFGTAY